jgi:choline/glycine/proline betaine transport protein
MGMAQTFVHWGLHPWALYAVLGMALAYAIHRRGRPLSIRWALEPLLGNRVKGWAGDLIDVIAIFGTVFGIATSLGLGVQQISAGLKHIGVVGDYDNTFLIILIVIITFLATASVVSGVGAGIKWLSNINLTMAGVLLVTVLVLGPTLFLFQNFVESLGVWLANVLDMTFDIGAYTGDEGNEWNSTWTLFYWGWWISWAPFVGVFIARISRGRTVREFIAGVLLVPSIVGFFWFSVLGGTGIHTQLFGSGDLVDPDEGVVAERVLFDVLGALPLGSILSVIAIIPRGDLLHHVVGLRFARRRYARFRRTSESADVVACAVGPARGCHRDRAPRRRWARRPAGGVADDSAAVQRGSHPHLRLHAQGLRQGGQAHCRDRSGRPVPSGR